MKVAKGPTDSHEVGNIRVTSGRTVSGKDFIIRDMWKESVNPHRKVEAFVGETVFEHAYISCQRNPVCIG